ncbi:MAG TPA: gluconate 2-dehydrogenase subunit 3 family protein [Burkholderiales bacterium]|nr:gluconate 2-dehydrogenase subunit 3 family protein [Burkholderiales bacterium]
MKPHDPSRRRLFRAAGAAGLAAAVPLSADAQSKRTTYSFFNAQEASFVEAAVARLIPRDELGPGAQEAGVPTFIDRQLAGRWGAGERLYRSGPWRQGTAGQGYQLPFTPAELFRNALRALDSGFAQMPVQKQDAYLDALHKNKRDLNGVPSNVFFETLLALTIEGFFSDPVYGGNRDMVGWKLIGFPGAYANYYELVDRHGVKFDAPPMSLGQDARGHIHIHPDASAGNTVRRK